MTKHLHKPGDKVQSTYRARWYGTVISTFNGWVNELGQVIPHDYHKLLKWRGMDPRYPHLRVFWINESCCLVRSDRDSSGNPHRKVFFKVYHESWFRPCHKQ